MNKTAAQFVHDVKFYIRRPSYQENKKLIRNVSRKERYGSCTNRCRFNSVVVFSKSHFSIVFGLGFVSRNHIRRSYKQPSQHRGSLLTLADENVLLSYAGGPKERVVCVSCTPDDDPTYVTNEDTDSFGSWSALKTVSPEVARKLAEDLCEECSSCLVNDGNPENALLKAQQARSMLKVKDAFGKDFSDVLEEIDSTLTELMRLSEIWLETGVSPYGYGKSSDAAREATAKTLFEEADKLMMEKSNESSALSSNEIMELVYRAEAALNYTKDDQLMEQIEFLIGAVLEMNSNLIDVVTVEEEVEELEDVEEIILTPKERELKAIELVSEADKYFEDCEIQLAIERAKEAIEFTYEGSDTWEQAMLVLGQGYQRIRNDSASSEVFSRIQERGRSRKTKVLAAQLQAIAEAPDLKPRNDSGTSISMLPREAYMGGDVKQYKRNSKLTPTEILIEKQSKSADKFFQNKFLVLCTFAITIYVAWWSTTLR